ncbi:hypothetical protein FA13DRAFT_1733907 [Coprinellus micaceus]|uniref:Uncharacterized protein n=1 Tax=Coprinellus micaceus TaxID=71717 RepID=A0A4Y7T7E1_COPMI|nr:hypothetical protein FA13DRAFT_1733907 [Coprinellus micaceus]
MDDDFTFGASVWAIPDPVDEKPPAATAESPIDKRKPPAPLTLDAQEDNFAPTDTGFDDFDDDDFGAPAEAVQFTEGKDDDFGDFEDFEEGEDNGGFAAPVSFQDVQFEDPFAAPGPSRFRPWQPLKLDPVPSYPDLQEEISEILNPIWADEDISKVTTDDPMREVEGVGQILVTPSSRQMHKSLLHPPSSLRPPNWTRSRIRRQHLISLGIPVNLDEVLPQANGRPMPTLEVRTRPMSAPPDRKPLPPQGPRSNHPSRSGPRSNLVAQFGPKPELDTTKINRLLEFESDYLAMQPLPNLERILSELKMQTANTSGLLTYLLQSREALQQDSETYNGLIANLVSEMAQKVKSGKPMGRSMSVRR